MVAAVATLQAALAQAAVAARAAGAPLAAALLSLSLLLVAMHLDASSLQRMFYSHARPKSVTDATARPSPRWAWFRTMNWVTSTAFAACVSYCVSRPDELRAPGFNAAKSAFLASSLSLAYLLGFFGISLVHRDLAGEAEPRSGDVSPAPLSPRSAHSSEGACPAPEAAPAPAVAPAPAPAVQSAADVRIPPLPPSELSAQQRVLLTLCFVTPFSFSLASAVVQRALVDSGAAAAAAATVQWVAQLASPLVVLRADEALRDLAAELGAPALPLRLVFACALAHVAWATAARLVRLCAGGKGASAGDAAAEEASADAATQQGLPVRIATPDGVVRELPPVTPWGERPTYPRERELRDVSAFPPPYPNGWYRVADSAAVARRAVVPAYYLGMRFGVTRGASGAPLAFEVCCGKVRAVEQGFSCDPHGCAWGLEGALVVAGRDSPRVASRVLPATDYYGSVCVYFDADRQPPPYELDSCPEIDSGAYVYRGRRQMYAKMHLQDFAENSADIAHFSILHRRFDMPIVGRFFDIDHNVVWYVDPDKPHVCHFDDAAQLMSKAGVKYPKTGAVANVSFLGPGGVVVFRFKTPVGGVLLFKKFTPTSALVQDVHDIWFAEKRVPRVLVSYLVSNAFAAFSDDVFVWENKTYARRPLVLRDDGPMLPLRRWCKQFWSPNSVSCADALRAEQEQLTEDE